MRLFVFSPLQMFSFEEIRKKSGGSILLTRKELNILIKADFIKKRQFIKLIERTVRGKKSEIKKKMPGFALNDRFPYLHQFRNLLIDTVPLRGTSIARRFNRAGKIKLLVTSGIFLQEPESRLDIMIVGDRLNRNLVDKTIKSLETEIGKELKYAVFDTPDFNYRLSVYDRLVRDVLDYPHEKILDKMNFGSDE